MHTFIPEASYTILIYIKKYRLLTSQLQQNGINRAGHPLTETLLRLYGGQKKLAKKKPFWGKKATGNLGRNHGPNSKQLAAHPARLYSSNKINFKTSKEKLGISQRLVVGSEGLDGDHVLYSLLYTTASLPLGPRTQALSYHVPTKYLFLPNSQAQSLEIPLKDNDI